MKILLLAPHPFYQERGTPIAVRLLATTLAEQGHAVDMLCYHEGRDLDMPGVRLHRISPPGWVKNVPPGPSWQKIVCDLYMWPAARRLAARGGFDLVHAVEEAAFMALRLNQRFGLPYVYDMDSCMSAQIADKYPAAKPLAGWLSRLEGRAVRDSAGVVAVCQSLVDTAQAHGPSAPVCRLEDVSLLEEPEGEPPSERLDYGGPVIMYVGNLESYQGIDLLLEGFAVAAPKHPQAHLVIIGGSQSAVAAYKAKAGGMGLEHRAHFLGPRPPAHLGHYLAQADILASPRIQGENTPMKIYSYLDADRPLVATRLPTHTQVLDNQISLLVEPAPEDMARGLDELLSDPERGRALARAAKERVAARYSLAAYRKKLLDFYAQVQAGCSGGRP
ncbi:MAG: glycosyltransferase family 4 protein [Desulfarculaceae bacterium]|nr:glycosyltransferase family 4 protein [Desulfarculaceae bacterium]MCF8072762.1 glycosyltransferase family 4 protein [Desulfarculaceae bacterium]MCF8100930.1 glycosyltransferase family 4 protein [Desulfarculaceae bacterium]MCF8117586.1 glycosyltransferase family 4 protein [Desulfarculaceae bacterium]